MAAASHEKQSPRLLDDMPSSVISDWTRWLPTPYMTWGVLAAHGFSCLRPVWAIAWRPGATGALACRLSPELRWDDQRHPDGPKAPDISFEYPTSQPPTGSGCLCRPWSGTPTYCRSMIKTNILGQPDGCLQLVVTHFQNECWVSR